MNISLLPSSSSSSKGKSKAKLQYGLNDSKQKDHSSSSNNVFGDDDDDDDDDDEAEVNESTSDHRSRVNQQIRKEQEALRKRAQRAALAQSKDIYDYDGAYDSFSTNNNNDTNSSTADGNSNNNKTSSKKSKYIQDLLQAAEARKNERELILERKIAREQKQEEQENLEYQGKEKFITSAYKRKLEERKQWEAKEEEKQREEETNDVTKQTEGIGFAKFYGNLNSKQTTADATSTTKKSSPKDNNYNGDEDSFEGLNSGGNMGFLSGFERSATNNDGDYDDDDNDNDKDNEGDLNGDQKNDLHVNDDKASKHQVAQESYDHHAQKNPNASSLYNDKTTSDRPELSLRELREKRVAEARIRYLERKKRLYQ